MLASLLVKAFGLSLENPSVPLLPTSFMEETMGANKSDAGILVNEKNALRLTTCYQCINVISQDLSRLPLCVYQQLANGSLREAPEHKLYPLLKISPNSSLSPNMTAMDFRRAMLVSILLYGNGYAQVLRDNAMRVIGLNPMHPDKISPRFTREGQLVYVTTQTPNGHEEMMEPYEVLHVKGFTLDGIVGLSPIQVMRNAFGLGLAAERFGAQFFGNGARASGIFTTPGTLSTEAFANLKSSLQERIGGGNTLKPLILEEGLQWQQLTIAPDDAQFLQTRQFQRSEICGIFRVPPHMVASLERSTNNNIEHQGKEYVQFTLAPLAVSIEQQIGLQLLKPPFCCEHQLNELARGDFAAQTSGLATLRQWGYYTIDDGLRDLRKNPVGGEIGSSRMAPVNMVPMDKWLEGPQPVQTAGDDPNEEDDPPGNPAAKFQAFRAIFRDAVGRIANRKPERRRESVRQILTPALESLASANRGGEPTSSDHAVIDSLLCEMERVSESWDHNQARTISEEIFLTASGALHGQR